MISINIAVIGKINVGKTSIIRLIKKEKIGIVKKRQSTTSIENYSFNTDHKLNFYDTYGFKPYCSELVDSTLSSINKEIKDIDAYLYIYDAEIGMDDVDDKIIESIDKDKIIFCINKVSNDEETIENINKIKNKYNDVITITNASLLINHDILSTDDKIIINNEHNNIVQFINQWCTGHHEQIIKIKKDRLSDTQNMNLIYAIKVFMNAVDSGIIGKETSIEEFIDPILNKYTTKASEISEKESINSVSDDNEECEYEESNDGEEEEDGEENGSENDIKMEESDEEVVDSELYDDTFINIYTFKTYLDNFNSQIYKNIIQTYYNTRCFIINDHILCNIQDFEECFGKDRGSYQSLLYHCLRTISSASTDKIKTIEDIYPDDQMDFLIDKSSIIMNKKQDEYINLIESIIIKFIKYCLDDKTYDTIKQFIKFKIFSNNINTLKYYNIALNLDMEDSKFLKNRLKITKEIIDGKENLITPLDSLLNLFIELNKHPELCDTNEQLDAFIFK